MNSHSPSCPLFCQTLPTTNLLPVFIDLPILNVSYTWNYIVLYVAFCHSDKICEVNNLGGFLLAPGFRGFSCGWSAPLCHCFRPYGNAEMRGVGVYVASMLLTSWYPGGRVREREEPESHCPLQGVTPMTSLPPEPLYQAIAW